MNVLVTGVAGFIGSALAKRLLKEGYKVIGIDNFDDYYPKVQKEKNIKNILEDKNFKFIEADLVDIDLENIINKVEFIFHQAARPGVRTSFGTEFDKYIRNNTQATQRLLEASLKAKKLKKITIASSSSVYGQLEKLPATEEDKTFPLSPYGVTKLCVENLAFSYAKNFSLNILCLRYFTVYGPSQRPDMAIYRFLKNAIKNQKIQIYGDGSQKRDFTFIDDVIDATTKAGFLLSDSNYQILNIASGKTITINQVLKIIKNIVGKVIEIEYKEKQKGDVFATWADITKAQNLLGYQPKISMEEGIYREYLWLRDEVDW